MSRLSSLQDELRLCEKQLSEKTEKLKKAQDAVDFYNNTLSGSFQTIDLKSKEFNEAITSISGALSSCSGKTINNINNQVSLVSQQGFYQDNIATLKSDASKTVAELMELISKLKQEIEALNIEIRQLEREIVLEEERLAELERQKQESGNESPSSQHQSK